jgi:hypothetical protein
MIDHRGDGTRLARGGNIGMPVEALAAQGDEELSAAIRTAVGADRGEEAIRARAAASGAGNGVVEGPHQW